VKLTEQQQFVFRKNNQWERHFIEVLTVGLAVLAKTPLAVVAIAGCSSHVDSNCSSSFLVIKTALKISDTSSKVSHRHGICSGRRAEISVHPVKIFSSPYFPACGLCFIICIKVWSSLQSCSDLVSLTDLTNHSPLHHSAKNATPRSLSPSWCPDMWSCHVDLSLIRLRSSTWTKGELALQQPGSRTDAQTCCGGLSTSMTWVCWQEVNDNGRRNQSGWLLDCLIAWLIDWLMDSMRCD